MKLGIATIVVLMFLFSPQIAYAVGKSSAEEAQSGGKSSNTAGVQISGKSSSAADAQSSAQDATTTELQSSADDVLPSEQQKIDKAGIVNGQYEASGADKIQNAFDKAQSDRINQDRNIFDSFDMKATTASIASGNISFDFGDIINNILKIFFKEFFESIAIFIQILILSILCSLLTNMQNNFNANVSEVAFFVCYAIISSIAVKCFLGTMEIGTQAVSSMVTFMQALIPVLMMLIMSTGGVSASAVFSPALMFAVDVISTLMQSFVMPLMFCCAALSIINNITEKYQVTKLISLIKQTIKWGMGALMTVFIGVITMQSVATTVVDGLAKKSAKFAIGNFVPLVGNILSDSIDLVLSCAVLLKSAIGVAGVAGLVFIVAIPIIKLTAQIGIFRLSTAVIEPVTDKRIVNCISGLADVMSIMLAVTVCITLMFVVTVTVIICAGNIAAMQK